MSKLQPAAKQSYKRHGSDRVSKLKGPRGRAARHTNYLHLDEIFSFFKDITAGLAHLHANGYVHRDLKPQNCLLHQTGGVLKLLVSDFGEMQGATDLRKADATGYTGTVSFAAPEVIRRHENGMLGNFTIKSDVFSLGMILFFMCFGRLPYNSANLEEDEKEDIEGLKDEVLGWTGLHDERKERSDLPEKLYENLQLLLSQDPEQRPTTEEILRRIRTGTSFSEHGGTSPATDQFPPLDFGYQKDRSKSPKVSLANGLGNSSAVDRRPSSSHHDTTLLRQRNSKFTDSRATAVAGPPLLMAPPSPSRRQRLEALMSYSNIVLAIQGLLFLLKLWTISSPCYPRAPRNEIQYPLMVVAAIDLALFKTNLSISIPSAIFHSITVLVAVKKGSLCQA